MAIEHIKLSQQEKDQLVKLKRNTGIQNWNVLCRWAFCVSLAEPSAPAPARIPSDSNVEMTWKVFAGVHSELFLALLKKRVKEDGFDTDNDSLHSQLKLHLHRGIGYLSADNSIKNVASLIQRIGS